MANPLAVQRNYPPNKINLEEAFKLRYKNGLTYQEIADHYGVTKSSVFQRLEKITNLLPDPEEIENYRQHKAMMLDGLEYKVYENMLNPEKLKDASFNNLAYGFQNICTQNRLEKGLSTSNVSAVEIHASISDLQTQASKLRDQLKYTIQDVVSKADNSKT